MNIDDFLDNASIDDKVDDDIIDISHEDLPQDSPVSLSISSSSLDNSSKDQQVNERIANEEKVIVKSNPSLSLNKSEQELQADSGVKNSSLPPQIPNQRVISEKMNFSQAISLKDLNGALTIYKKEMVVYQRIPESQFEERFNKNQDLLKKNALLKTLHLELSKKAEEVHKKINDLCIAIKISLGKRDVLKASGDFKKAASLLSQFPKGFTSVATKLSSDLSLLRNKILSQNSSYLEEKLLIQKQKITMLLRNSDVAFKNNELRKAESFLNQAQNIFNSMSFSSHFDGLIFSQEILKRQKKIGLLNQISYLQKEFQNSFSTPLPSKVSSFSSSSKNLLKSSLKSNVVSKQKKLSKPFIEEKHFKKDNRIGLQQKSLQEMKQEPEEEIQQKATQKTTQEITQDVKNDKECSNVIAKSSSFSSSLKPLHLKEASSSSSNKSELVDVVDDSYKKLLLSTVRVDLLNQKYEDALNHLHVLDKNFGTDLDVIKFIKAIRQGLAGKKPLIPSTPSSLSSSPSSSISSQRSLKESNKKLGSSKPHKVTLHSGSDLVSVDDKLKTINDYYLKRKIALGKLHFRKRDFDKVRHIVDNILKIDPENKEALALKKEVWQDD